MKTIEFLKANGSDFNKLNQEFGIKIKHYPVENLYVLNYDQIESPKTNEIVMECRGLILDGNLNVVCRPFDRFFNFGEAGTENYDFDGYTFAQKMDGSLIKVFYWNDQWRIATRGTAFAESDVGSHGITFQELALKAAKCRSMEHFSAECYECGLDINHTYLFELTAMENRVVTRYSKPELTLLAIRSNKLGHYVPTYWYEGTNLDFWKNNKTNGFPLQHAIESSKTLGNLEEGFVGYDKEGVPRIKIKSPAYVAIHHLRDNGSLQPKRVAELVLSGEVDEYLTYFEEDREFIEPYSLALTKLVLALDMSYSACKDIESQKDFAIAIKDVPSKAVLFTARKYGITVGEAFNRSTLSSKVDMLLNFMKD